MIQLTNFYHDSSIYVNPDAIASITDMAGTKGSIINTVSGNSISVKEEAHIISGMLIAAKRG